MITAADYWQRVRKGVSPPVPAASPPSAPAAVPAIVPTPPQPDPSGEEVEKLLAEMREGARRAGMQRDDPLMPLLTSLAHSIRFLGDRTSRSDKVAQDASTQIIQALLQSRQNADAEIARFQAGVASSEADTIQRVGSAIAQSADAALTRRVKVFDRNTALSAAATLFGVAIACLGGGYWWGHRSAAAEIHETELGLQAAFKDDPATAKMWLGLMQWNSLSDALTHCRDPRFANVQDGRRGCAVPFWIQAPVGTTPDLHS
ncbi:hypothetical protein HN018_27395 (plasmid) [Lichenicola cladoniae]|uniref:Uncharacterized protein n=1 Tax=Lichenicola cladoniae TaxID=1484109 RepID=A0A6M8HZB0_9PROT|nr:hypothetical protein [Lichenicola cladoniae]NPD69994.1 hypothetical protein [Acetobacteraceae bacterium]QKE93863.1 hypothetical protein HN018_27395 [Lichenicola cladoniae]